MASCIPPSSVPRVYPSKPTRASSNISILFVLGQLVVGEKKEKKMLVDASSPGVAHFFVSVDAYSARRVHGHSFQYFGHCFSVSGTDLYSSFFRFASNTNKQVLIGKLVHGWDEEMDEKNKKFAFKIYLYLGALFITSLVVSNLIFQKFFFACIDIKALHSYSGSVAAQGQLPGDDNPWQ